MNNKKDLGKLWAVAGWTGYTVIVAGVILYPLQYTDLAGDPLISFWIVWGIVGSLLWGLLCWLVYVRLTKRARQNRLNQLSEKGPRYTFTTQR